mgnify:CR=1 FL=1
MVSFEEIQAAYYMVAATGVLVAAVYYILNMRVAQKTSKQTLDTRQIQLFMNVYQRFEQPDFQDKYWEIMSWQWKDFEDFWARYGQEANPKDFRLWVVVGTFFEGIGVLVKRGFIDAMIVDDLMSMFIILWWQKFEPIFIGMRKLWNTPTVSEYGEELYNVVYGIWREQHPGYVKPIMSP